MNEGVYQFPHFLPTPTTENENRIICIRSGGEKPFTCLARIPIANLVSAGGFGTPTQCFPFYTYNEDGTNRRENITDWALARFREVYGEPLETEFFPENSVSKAATNHAATDQTLETEQISETEQTLETGFSRKNPVSGGEITKWDIFHYIYALLHHPVYRETYAANLRRELPRIPFVRDFWAYARAGARLAEIHVGYEQQPEYPLRRVENSDERLDWRVEKMRLSKDKTQIRYNDFLTLDGIPAAAFDYRLGNRSALEWVIDQYRVKTDKRSGITNDPNRDDDPQYIVRLIGQVIAVSLETVEIVKGLPEWKVLGEE